MRNLGESGGNRSYAVGGSSLGYPPLFPLTSTAFFSLYLDPSSLLPTPFRLIKSLLPLPTSPGITVLLFYQPEHWIKPSSGKNLVTYKIHKGYGGGSMGTMNKSQKLTFCLHF